MKRSRRNLSKRGLVGLHRVGAFPKREWKFNGKTFRTLREVRAYANGLKGKNKEKDN